MSAYRCLRGRRRPTELSAKPQITSYADVTLSLLVIFLVSVSAALQMVDVSLPEATNSVSRDINLAVTVSLSNQKPTPGSREQARSPKPVARSSSALPAAPKAEATDKKAGGAPWLFYFEDDTTGVEAKNLWTALKAIKGDSPWPLALLRADKDAPCEQVSILIQCLQGLGVGEIAFVISSEQ